MSCFYADIAMFKYGSLANKFHLKPSVRKRFKDSIFLFWEHAITFLSYFLDNSNTTDKQVD